MSLRLSVEAEEDLISIYVHGVRAFGEAQAERYYADLRATFALIDEHPLLAREQRQFTPPIRMHPHGGHLILYTTDETGVLVLRVVSHRQDWARLLSEGG